MTRDDRYAILQGNVLDTLKQLPDSSVHTCVTSPPYYGLRNYGTNPQIWGGDPNCAHQWVSATRKGITGGTKSAKVQIKGQENFQIVPDSQHNTCELCGAWQGELGGEPAPEMYIEHLVRVFREVRRVLHNSGTLWVNIGDSYGHGTSALRQRSRTSDKISVAQHTAQGGRHGGVSKQLMGIPWMLAFALRADGWILRSDIIWCLSGGTELYVRSQKGDMPMTIKDMVRLDPKTIKLWNGKNWVNVLGYSKSKRRGDEIQILLRSGERIACTPTHQFPTQRGLVAAGDLVRGDVLCAVRLPEPDTYLEPKYLDNDVAWFIGMYIAEGSRSGESIQISGHAKEDARWKRLDALVRNFGGSASLYVDGNIATMHIRSKMLSAALAQFVSGRVAHDKGLAPVVWRYSNAWLESLLRGYLDGDGHYDEPNNRWRIGFTRNYNLERDLRTICGRLGLRLTLNFSTVPYNGQRLKTFRGEIRFERSGHLNEKEMTEVVSTQKAKCRFVYDIGVEGEPHLFALASGVLTHNSKPNVMPESVTDRPTKSHEYIFLLAKSSRYFYDNEAVKEKSSGLSGGGFSKKYAEQQPSHGAMRLERPTDTGTRNRRSVWTVNTKPYRGAHFAVYPGKLIEPCILAGSSERGVCSECGAPWVRAFERTDTPVTTNKGSAFDKGKTGVNGKGRVQAGGRYEKVVTGWRPGCVHDGGDLWEEYPREPKARREDSEIPEDGPRMIAYRLEVERVRQKQAELLSRYASVETVPATVLDPFVGSGTTIAVALNHGRRAIGCELNPKYIELAHERIAKEAPPNMFRELGLP